MCRRRKMPQIGHLRRNQLQSCRRNLSQICRRNPSQIWRRNLLQIGRRNLSQIGRRNLLQISRRNLAQIGRRRKPLEIGRPRSHQKSKKRLKKQKNEQENVDWMKPIKFLAGFESAKNILVLDFDLAGEEVKERWTKITEARIRAEIEQNLQQERLDIDFSRSDLLDYVSVSWFCTNSAPTNVNKQTYFYII